MVSVQDVSKQYTSGRGRVTALAEISFSVQSGQGIILAGSQAPGKQPF